jgi:uncharacterized phiE125 gp8 family phage protein
MDPLTLKLITPPIAEPVTLAQAKAQCRIDFTDDDALVTALISSARRYCEQYQHLCYFSQTWMRTMDFFPIWLGSMTVNPSSRAGWMYFTNYWDAVRIDLPYGATSITSINYLDSSTGQSVALSSTAYQADLTSVPARLVPSYGTCWPATELYAPGSVQITYVSGIYGDGVSVNNIPPETVQAILMLIDHWYNHRGVVSEKPTNKVPLAVKTLLDLHKHTSFSIQ